MKPKLAVIGGNYFQLPLVKKAQEMGLEVHCFAWEEGAVCKDVADFFYPISIVEKEQILGICSSLGIDGVTSIASDLAVLTVNYVAEQMGLVSNKDKYSLIQTNKYLMRQCFEDLDVPSPRFCLVKSIGDVLSFEGWQWPLIVKPTDRSGSRAVVKVDNYDQLKIAIKEAIEVSFAKEAIVEEYVAGQEVSVEAISWEGRHYILQITDKVTNEHFVEIAHHQPSLLSNEIQDRIRGVVLKALDALHVEYGASHSELKITDDGSVKVMEVGARMGGGFIGSHLVPLSTGYDYVRGVIEIALGHFNKPVIDKNLCSGVFFLIQETSYLMPIIQESNKYPEIVFAKQTEETIRPGVSESNRTGYVIYQSDHRINSFKHD